MTHPPAALFRPSAPRTARSLFDDVRGTAILEFALCGAMFIALLLAAAQVALIYFVQQGMQTAAEATARKVMTGAAQTGNMSQSQFKAMACTNLPSYLNCSKLLVDVRRVTAFDQADTNPIVLTFSSNGVPTTPLQYDIGAGEGIVVLRLMYIWNTSAGPLSLNLSNQNGRVRTISGTMVFKSEPFVI